MPLRHVVQSLRLRAADAADVALRRRDRLVPPRRRLDFVGDSDFGATGAEFLGHFRELAGLRSSDRVLDVGCGIGRMARVLAAELQPPGCYDGFDIVPDAIRWCRRHYRGLPAQFRFEHADIHNSRYNPRGALRASDYRFPYADASFDLVIAVSVFTHLLADAAENYLAEAGRVLAPGGRLFATWFLIGAVGDRPQGAAFDFAHPAGPAAVADPSVPEAAVAYPESWVRARLEAHRLRARGPVHRGSWRGAHGRSFQDIFVADRP